MTVAQEKLLKDKVAIITGASEGLGFEIATITAVDNNNLGGTEYEVSHENIIVVAIPVNDDLIANEINLTTDEEVAVTVDLYEHIINVDDIILKGKNL